MIIPRNGDIKRSLEPEGGGKWLIAAGQFPSTLKTIKKMIQSD